MNLTGTAVADLPQFICLALAEHVDKTLVHHVLSLFLRGLFEFLDDLDSGWSDASRILIQEKRGEVRVAASSTAKTAYPPFW